MKTSWNTTRVTCDIRGCGRFVEFVDGDTPPDKAGPSSDEATVGWTHVWPEKAGPAMDICPDHGLDFLDPPLPGVPR